MGANTSSICGGHVQGPGDMLPLHTSPGGRGAHVPPNREGGAHTRERGGRGGMQMGGGVRKGECAHERGGGRVYMHAEGDACAREWEGGRGMSPLPSPPRSCARTPPSLPVCMCAPLLFMCTPSPPSYACARVRPSLLGGTHPLPICMCTLPPSRSRVHPPPLPIACTCPPSPFEGTHPLPICVCTLSPPPVCVRMPPPPHLGARATPSLFACRAPPLPFTCAPPLLIRMHMPPLPIHMRPHPVVCTPPFSHAPTLPSPLHRGEVGHAEAGGTGRRRGGGTRLRG